MLHVYVKEQQSLKRKLAHAFSYVSLTVGSLLLFWSFYPIISFEIYSRLFIQNNVSSPIPQNQIASALDAANSVLGSYDVFSNNLRDFIQADQWFPTKPKLPSAQTKKKIDVKQYTLSIPKLNIQDAVVTVDGQDLSKSLVHYMPVGLPGERGNVAIFGHSTLPALFNPKKYTTIFTFLSSLEKGDRIYIHIGDSDLEYEVFDMFIVHPDQISVLDQKYDDSYVTLITCTPPGTVSDRLIVRTRLVKRTDNN